MMKNSDSFLLGKSDKIKKFCAISYESVTFQDLKFFLKKNHQVDLARVDPEHFIEMLNKDQYNFINLMTNQPSRKKISELMDENLVSSFKYIADIKNIADPDNIGFGSFLYPSVTVYPGSTVGENTLIHSSSTITHKCNIGKGCFFSVGVSILGSCTIGDFCWLGAKSTVLEKISVPNSTWISASRTVRSNKEF